MEEQIRHLRCMIVILLLKVEAPDTVIAAWFPENRRRTIMRGKKTVKIVGTGANLEQLQSVMERYYQKNDLSSSKKRGHSEQAIHHSEQPPSKKPARGIMDTPKICYGPYVAPSQEEHYSQQIKDLKSYFSAYRKLRLATKTLTVTEPGSLGITFSDSGDSDPFRIRIEKRKPDSVLKLHVNVGDYIVEINGTPVENTEVMTQEKILVMMKSRPLTLVRRRKQIA